MKFTDNPVMILVGLITLAIGAFTFFDARVINILDERVMWGVLVVAVLIILYVLLGKPEAPIGLILLAIFLASLLVVYFFHIQFAYRDQLIAAIAVASGAFMLIGL